MLIILQDKQKTQWLKDNHFVSKDHYFVFMFFHDYWSSYFNTHTHGRHLRDFSSEQELTLFSGPGRGLHGNWFAGHLRPLLQIIFDQEETTLYTHPEKSIRFYKDYNYHTKKWKHLPLRAHTWLSLTHCFPRYIKAIYNSCISLLQVSLISERLW